MTIAKLGLTVALHCESHVFRVDEYAEIVNLYPNSICYLVHAVSLIDHKLAPMQN